MPEVEWARGRTQDPQHLRALVVWLKSYQRLGYFPKLDEVPEAVTWHVRGLLQLGDEVELERAAWSRPGSIRGEREPGVVAGRPDQPAE